MKLTEWRQGCQPRVDNSDVVLRHAENAQLLLQECFEKVIVHVSNASRQMIWRWREFRKNMIWGQITVQVVNISGKFSRALSSRSRCSKDWKKTRVKSLQMQKNITELYLAFADLWRQWANVIVAQVKSPQRAQLPWNIWRLRMRTAFVGEKKSLENPPNSPGSSDKLLCARDSFFRLLRVPNVFPTRDILFQGHG